MFDLFGLRKNEAEAAGPELEEPPATSGGGGSQKLWAILLVVDSLFVIVFGGGVAAKLYQHWKAPTQMPISQSARVSKKAKPAAPEVSTQAATAQEAPPAPATPVVTPPAPAPEPAQAGPKGRPSLLAESPKAHQPPKPQEAAKPEPAKPAAVPGEKPKAVAVEFKLKAPKAKDVQLAGAFIVRGNGRKAMANRGEGHWGLTLYLTPDTYRYWFVVDGKKVLDPENPKTERDASLRSVP